MSIAEAVKLQDLKKRLLSIDGLEDVDNLVRSKLTSDSADLVEVSRYLLDLGGKRIRPIVTLLCGKLLGIQCPSSQLIDIAAGIELIHMATLLHDDIIDSSPLRRKKESPFKRYGLTDTLLTGNFFYIRAFSLCARLDLFIIDETERACMELTEGEILETPLNQRMFTLEESLDISRRKTAALFRLGTVAAGHFAKVKSPVMTLLESFGENLGIAFQVIDDVLDVTADEAEFGKKVGGDILERKPSVVNVLWVNSGDPMAEKLLKEPRTSNQTESPCLQDALSKLRDGPVIEEAREIAFQYADKARSALGSIRSSTPAHCIEAHELLESIINYTLDRVN